MRSLIIIPTYNEIDNLKPLVESVLGTTPTTVDILVCDDGSPDGTGKLADTLAAQDSRVHVMHRPRKMGLASAYLQGFEWGLSRGYDVLIEMDADFSHHPSYLPQMLNALEMHDVAIGSRNIPGGGTLNWGMGRRILSKGGSFYSRTILGAPIRDFTGGFNGWRRQVLEKIDLPSIKSQGYSFQIELKYRAYLCGFSVHEFPIIFEDRKVGQSKMSKKIIFEALQKVWQFRAQAEKLRPPKLPRKAT